MPVRIHKALTNYLHGFPCGDFNEQSGKWALRMGVYQAETKKAEEEVLAKEEGNCLLSDAAGEDG